MPALLKPPRLRPGDTIGIFAPARWVEDDVINTGRTLLEARGYRVKPHPQLALRDGQCGGPAEARAEALHAMIHDKDIRAIFCARGGVGSHRLLDLIDSETIRIHPKILCGFSDITGLLVALHHRTGLVTFHGPMMWGLAKGGTPLCLDHVLAVLSDDRDAMTVTAATPALQTGVAEGRLIGGNMHLLQSLIGTRDDWNGKDSILFLEDVDEPLYKYDRLLRQFHAAGKFSGVRGVIVGEMMRLHDGTPGAREAGQCPYGPDWPTVLRRWLPENIPVCLDFPCGHGARLATFPLGVQARMEVTERKTTLSFLEAAVS